MTEQRARLAWSAVLGAGAMLAFLVVVGLGVVYSGAVNVAATEEHGAFTRWALDTTFRRSVARQARGVGEPPPFTPAMVAAGAGEYRAMCQRCHGGPGVEREPWANAMRPRPPHLTETAAEWSPREVFWLVDHGVKATGMPAFGPTHDGETLWAIAAFVGELPAMTAARYAELTVAGDEGDGHQHTHG